MEPAEPKRTCLPIVERGCCCELATCCKVQGWLLIVGATLNILKSIAQLYNVSEGCNALKQQGRSCFGDEDLKSIFYFFICSLVLNIIIQIIFLVTAVLFLQGIANRNPSKMAHYIRLMWVQLVVGTIAVIVMSVLVSPVLLLAFLFIGLPIYCLICANSLKIQMETNKNGQDFANPMA
ncbi:uncharacterized protein LOC117640075 [Thrips palmi]|uniref:Uncharacterized protein LOC117640075 n=1 Tax=Thrips palmi TaxID=161013 RepID=A0A6P8XYM9_THRPL|nr:uncharacterized protein LOC117640075 [Thrips palmi]